MNERKRFMSEEREFELSKLIAAYLTDSLSVDERQRFEALLKSDRRLQRLVSRYSDAQKTQERMDYLSGLDIESSLQKVYRKRQGGASGSLKRYLPYAAAIFVGFLMVALWTFRSGDDPRIVEDTVYGYKNDVLPGEEKAHLILSDGKVVELGSDSPALSEIEGAHLQEHNGELSFADQAGARGSGAFHTLVVPDAGTFRLILADGTKVWLNANSKIEFPSRFGGSERMVKLEGEAFFEVAHDLKKPFRVKVSDRTITALGTSFNINAYDEGVLSTTLLSGKVRASNGSKQAVLEPGERLVMKGSEWKIGQANIDKELAWKNGYFSFDGETIHQAMDQIGRWYGIKVHFRGDIKGEQLGGSISRNVNLSEVVEMLKEVSGLTFRIDGKELFVTKQ